MRRYNSFADFLKKQFGERLQKISIHAGFSCPNRDGNKGWGGCKYCNNDAFVPNYTKAISINQQLEEGILFHSKRYRRAEKFLAYFQAYTSTYADENSLFLLWQDVLAHPNICGMVVSTRPDCLTESMLERLNEWNKTKIIFVELGIESVFDQTLQQINRGHSFADTVKSLELLAKYNMFVNAHYILGLPGETLQHQVEAAGILSTLPIHALKLHQLQIVKGSTFDEEYKRLPHHFQLLELPQYIEWVATFLQYLNPDIMIDRFASEVPPRFLVAPDWGLIRYDQVLALIEGHLEENDIFQGERF